MRERPYYQAKVRMRDGAWFIIEGDNPFVLYALETGYRGDFCRWMLEQQSKTWLRSWAPPWRLKIPPRPWDMRLEPIDDVSRVAAWLLTAVAIWSGLR